MLRVIALFALFMLGVGVGFLAGFVVCDEVTRNE